MSLETSKKIIENANGKPIGAFNILSLEMLQAVVNVAEKMKASLIIQLSQGALKWAKFNYLVPMVVSAVKNAKVPLAIHLDHATDIELVKKAVDSGFSSVMYDGSLLPIDQNIKNSLEVIAYCRKKNVSVEIEIGKVGGKEDDLSVEANEIVNEKMVMDFYTKTKPDLLAVSFGTSHGKYKSKEINLNYELIKNLSTKMNVPLVMHGTSGVPFKMIKKAINNGIKKVNIGTDLLIANFKAIGKYLKDNPEEYNIRKINSFGIKSMEEKVGQYLELFK